MRQKKFSNIKFLKSILRKEKSKKIFLVTGKTSFEKSGAKKEFDKILRSQKYVVKRFSEFSPNPKIEQIKLGQEIFEKDNFDIIVSIGGGSSIDVAKSIKLFSKKNVPLIAVPTTAGSGSESTYFIVYYNGKNKQSKGDIRITLPNYIILDPNLIKSLPKKIMASSGMDALGQAIESYWSIHSTKESKKYSKKAIKLMMRYLESAVNKKDKKSLRKIMTGSNLAGKAINITKTTACHSLAYPMTSYFNIPHGHAVGLTLGEMLEYNSRVSEKDCLDERGIKYVKKTILEICKLIGANNVGKTSKKLYSMMNKIGLETKLSKLNIGNQGIQKIIKKGFAPERMKNNPRRINSFELQKILGEIA